MLRIAEAIREVGGVDGVVGFSQGASCAAILAALLEDDPATGKPRQAPAKAASGVYDFESFLPTLRKANGGKPLKFAVAYSGFFAPVKEFAWMYEPPIATPTMHFIGSLDTVVDEGRSRGLVERCVDPVVVVHPGGHYVPVSKEWVAPLVGFVKSHAGEDGVASQL
jgi:pimeloyl-ACP methyl ester carboxylesterase